MLQPFSDGEAYCLDWLEAYSLQQIASYTVPLAILIVNGISKKILRLMTTYEGFHSKPEEVSKSSVKMWVMAFVNTGLIVQIVYFDWFRGVSLPFLLTEYSEFTSEWYKRVGSTIVVTMSLMVFTPHIANLMF